jgi:hypothetical protein
MQLTEKEALAGHKDFWTRIVIYIRKTKLKDLPRKGFYHYEIFSATSIKLKVIKTEELDLMCYCYLCEYIEQINKSCRECPLDISCHMPESLYQRMETSETKTKLLKYAIKIRDVKE